MSATRPETGHQAVVHLVTGHFHETAPYQTWRQRGTDDWLLIYTLGGRGYFGYQGGRISAEPGDAMLLRPGTRHDYGVDPVLGGWELLWTHFLPYPAWHEWLAWPEQAPGLMTIALRDPALRETVARRFSEAHRLATGALPQRERFAMNALEEVLLWCETANPRVRQAPLDARVRDAMERLCQNLDREITLDWLAGHSGLSASRLSHLFRRQVGVTPQQFLEEQRLNRAKQLLALTPHSIQAIAAAVGFENPFYFTLRFKRQTGLSPRDYRRTVTETAA